MGEWHADDAKEYSLGERLRKPFTAAVFLLLGSAAVLAAVAAPVAFACPFGQVFEFDGCVPSPLLYSWTSSSPTAAPTPSVCVWEMPWGRMNLPCNIINCQTIIYPTGYALQSQPVSCSSLSVNVQRMRLGGPPLPLVGDNVSVSATLTCEGPGDTAGQVYINVSMTETTDSQGTAVFLIPSALGNDSRSSHASCYSSDSYLVAGGFAVKETNSGEVFATLSWPNQQSVFFSLPSAPAVAVAVRGHPSWFIV